MFSKLMDRMFDYLNRYSLKNQNLKTLGATSLELFNKNFYESIKEIFRKELLIAFTRDRNGEIVDKPVMTRAVNCYVQ